MTIAFAALLLLLISFALPCSSFRCWVCGEDAGPHDTNYGFLDGGKSGGGSLNRAWCTSSIAAAECSGQETFCYKELWTVDGHESG